MMRFYLRFGFLTGHTQYLSGEALLLQKMGWPGILLLWLKLQQPTVQRSGLRGIQIFLIQEKFIIFLAILLLVLLTMQFSMGFSARVVRVKAVFFVLFSIVFYLVIHITLYDEFAKQVREMLNIMKLPVKWW